VGKKSMTWLKSKCQQEKGLILTYLLTFPPHLGRRKEGKTPTLVEIGFYPGEY